MIDYTTKLKLIRFYCGNPCLWDFQSPNFSNRIMKNTLLRELSVNMNIPGKKIFELATISHIIYT